MKPAPPVTRTVLPFQISASGTRVILTYGLLEDSVWNLFARLSEAMKYRSGDGSRPGSPGTLPEIVQPRPSSDSANGARGTRFAHRNCHLWCLGPSQQRSYRGRVVRRSM